MLPYEEKLRLALLEQHHLYFDYSKRTLKPEYSEYIDCPVCGSNQSHVLFQKDWFTFCKCNQCSMVYLNPRLNNQATHAFYNSEWTFLYNERKFGVEDGLTNESMIMDDQQNVSNLDAILQIVGTRRGDLLEIGPGGRGVLLKAAREDGFRVQAVEIGEDNVRNLKKLLGDGAVQDKDLAKVGFDSNSFDVVYMRDVLEHVLNPKPLLEEVNRILRPGGIISIAVPNIEGLIYKLVRQNHVVIFGFAHVNYWSPQTLRRILNLTGFRVVDMRHQTDDFRVGALATYFLGQLPFTSVARRKVGSPNRLFVGLMRRATAHEPLKSFDDLLTSFADSTRRGSVLNAIAKKATN
jgi:2-polyprenyl-3-methyl-5-hydroxy-6-metoxy-1,4-benzoquinol methylase